MGAENAKVAYSADLIDLQVAGLSAQQVEHIKENFFSRATTVGNTGDIRVMTPIQLKELVKIPLSEAQLVVQLADLDGDGNLSDYEFICLVGLFTQENVDEKIKQIFFLHDLDRSEYLEEKEFKQIISTVICVNCNGREASDQEVQTMMKAIQEEQFFPDIKIRMSDFIKLCKENVEFRKALTALGIYEANKFEDNYDMDVEKETCKESEDQTKGINPQIVDQPLQNDMGIEIEETDEGNQFMAVKPYIGVVKNSVPSTFDPKKVNYDAPEANLQLTYVYGYRCFDTRNNIFFYKGKVVFSSAAVNIVLDTQSNTQVFNFNNTDDITAIDTNGTIFASGQIGNKPIINIWNPDTMQNISIIGGALQKGIAHIAFSQDGKTLAATGMNDDHDIAFFNLSQPDKPILLGSNKGVKDKILSLKFSKNDHRIVYLGTVRNIYLATIEGKSINISQVSGWKGSQSSSSLSLAPLEGCDIVVGLANGNIAQIRGKSIMQQIKAHAKGVFAMTSNQEMNVLYTGGGDGMIIQWNKELKQTKKISIPQLNLKIINPRVRAISIDKENQTLLVGTRSSALVLINLNNENDKRIVLRGHFDKELWALDVHPTKEEFITCGEDFLISKWSSAEKKQLMNNILNSSARTVAINHKGDLFCVGCDNGSIYIHSYDNIKEIFKKRISRKQISVVKYSPNDNILAVGTHDTKIYLLDPNDNYIVKNTLIGHHSTITHLDFSTNNNVLMSNCTSYEILYWSTSNGKQDTRGASNNKDEAWQTWTCVLGWPVQGIFPPLSDGSDINACDRINNKFLVTGDDFGKVKLFRYPVLEKAQFNQYVGHSSHVTNVKFDINGKYIFSTGGHDKSIFQWKLIDQQKETQQQEENQFEEAEIDENEFIAEDLHKNEQQTNEDTTQEQQAKQKITSEFVDIEEEDDGNQFMAIKPWIGDMNASTPANFVFKKGMDDQPSENIYKSYIHGYRSFDARHTAKFGQTENDVIFVSGSMGIKLDVKDNKQTFFDKHENDVISLAVHPDRQIAATGQMAFKSKSTQIDLYVWDIKTKKEIANLKGFHLRAVQHIRFSSDGKRLLTIGQDDDHSAAIYDWQNGRLTTSCKVDKKNVLDCDFTDSTHFMTCGSRHFKYFSINGRNISGKNLFSNLISKGEAMTALCGNQQSNGLAGSNIGSVFLVNNGSIINKLKVHEGAVYVIYYHQQSKHYFTGGKDGIVNELSADGKINIIKQIINASQMSNLKPAIRTIDILNNKMLVGTMASELILYDNYQSSPKGNIILRGHFEGELWGLSAHPKEPQFATCGDDGTTRTWDSQQNKQKGCIQVKDKLRAVDYHPSGQFIVSASYTGKLYLFNSELTQQLQKVDTMFNQFNQWIQDIKFSPNGQYLVYGAHGGRSPIDIYEFSNNKLVHYGNINVGFTSALLHIDWSTDSTTIVSNSEAYELKFANIPGKQQIRANSVKTTEWQTWTCKIGFPVQGIFEEPTGFSVLSVSRNNVSKNLLATGDTFELIKLFKYPSVNQHSRFKQYRAHGSHVTRVRFDYKDNYLLSTGGNDKSIMVWLTDFGEKTKQYNKLEMLANQVMPSQSNNLFNIEEESAQQTMPGQLTDESQNNDQNDEQLEDLCGIQIKKANKDKYNPQQSDQFEKDEQEDTQKEKSNGFVDIADNNNFYEVEEADTGNEFMAIKPWLGAIKAPNDYVSLGQVALEKPNVNAQLEYVHGFRSKDCRNNIFLLNNNLYYNAAALGVKLDINKNTQQFVFNHIDDVTAIAYCPNKQLFATGEIGPKPLIQIWDSNLQIVCSFKGVAIKGITSMAFSPNGNYLFATCVDDNHIVVLYDITNKKFMSSIKGGRDLFVSSMFFDDNTIITVGVKTYKEYKISNNQLQNPTNGKFLRNSSNILTQAIKYKDSVLCGSANGQLQQWKGCTVMKTVQLHKGILESIHITKSEMIITGGKDCQLCIVDQNLVLKYSLDINQIIGDSIKNHIKAIQTNEEEGKIYIGTISSDICELQTKLNHPLNLNETKVNADFKSRKLMSGHYARNNHWTNEVWGLAVLKNGNYMTVSDDGTLRLWSLQDRKQIKFLPLDINARKVFLPPEKNGDLQSAGKLRSIAIDNDDIECAVGCLDGTVRIINIEKFDQVKIIKRRNSWIQDLKYSPSGEYLAVGSHDDLLDIYKVTSRYSLYCTFKGFSSFITHLDWSVDSNYLHTNDGSYELLFWNINDGKQITKGATALRNEKWATWSCVLGWPVQGIMQAEYMGCNIDMVDRSHNQIDKETNLLAVAEDFSTIRLYRYPCIEKSTKSLVLKGHSSHVTNVKFSPDDDYLLSTGGEDQTVMQWKISKL